jgi:glycosyltransferase involved in cell wall biosynthesis
METIGVAIICRNSEATIKDCVESFIDHVDQVVIVKAGESTDKTAEILDRLKSAYPDKIELFDFVWIDDFSAARNFSFSKLKTSWALWVDSDDVIYQPENLRKLAASAQPEVGGIWFPYHYAIDEFGNPTTIYERERLLRTSCGWIWRSRIHETVSPLRKCAYVRTSDVMIRHQHGAGGNRSERNFRILELMAKEDPTDKRVWLYLGHQNFAAGFWAKSAEWYLKFGTDTGAIALERFQALCYCSKALRNMSDTQAIEVANMAVMLMPNLKDGYLEMAHSYLTFKDWDKAILYAQLSDVKGLMVEPPAMIFINPLEYTFNRYALLSEAHLRKGEIALARDFMNQAYAVRPTADVKNNIEMLEGMLRRERVQDGIRALSVELINTKEEARLEALLGVCPWWYREVPEYQQIRNGVAQRLKEVKDDPQIAVGENKSVTVNLGNSLSPHKLLETLDKDFDRVTVIAPLPNQEGRQVAVYPKCEVETLLMSSPGRSIINLRQEPTRIVAEYDHRKPPADSLVVRMYLGQGLEYWSPKTIAEVGCGGSETSAALLCKALAAKGNQPILYAMDDQIWDRVLYRREFNPGPCHLFIASRIPEILNEDIQARQKWLWVHDIHCWDRLTPEIAERIDCIVALSHWHVGHLKRTYPWLADAEVIDMDDQDPTYEDNFNPHTFKGEKPARLPKIAIIGDAIDTDRFRGFHEDKIDHSFIWCSSPDRGLEELLAMWPLILDKWPDATLRIFYGWDYFNSSLHIPAQREFKERIRRWIEQKGVKWCGRIGQDMLAHELKKAQILLYPPPHEFRETYGITFIEAQAARVLCFYRKNGALGETIGDRGIPLDLDMKPQEVVAKIINTVENRMACDIIKSRAKKYGMTRDWNVQADKFLALYRRLTNGDKNRPVEEHSP